MSFRILVTGSRDWTNDELIMDAMGEYLDREDVVLMHSASPNGADAIADRYAKQLGWMVEVYPSDWEMYKADAGHMSNMAMVAAGADICLAFIKDQSRDATHCAQYARMAHIKTIVYSQIGDYNDGKFVYCQDVLTFHDVYLHCEKAAEDNHSEHSGSGTDDEGKLYFMTWKDKEIRRG